MKGEEVKRILRANGITQKDLADKFGVSTQNISDRLSKDDIRTSLLEDIVMTTGIPMSAFYPDCGISQGDKSNAQIGQNSYNSTAMLEIAFNALKAQMKEKDEQIARLLSVIEKLSK